MISKICKRGHEQTGEAVRVKLNGTRSCRLCERKTALDYYYAHRVLKGPRKTWPPRRTMLQRIATKFVPHPTIEFNGHPCWEWKALRNVKGYGGLGGRMAHLVVWEQFRGKKPDGMQIDHLCRNKWCVNPSHLEVVTPSENVRRNWEHKKRNAN